MVKTPQQEQQYNGRAVLTAIEASDRSGLSHNYIWQLLHSGRIEGVKIGRDWLVYEDSLSTFLAQPRSRGRKGPRKKQEIRQEAQGERVLLSTAAAHEVSGYRQDHLLRLLRTGRIEGEKTGRTWLIYEDSLLAYKRRKHPSTTSLSSQ